MIICPHCKQQASSEDIIKLSDSDMKFYSHNCDLMDLNFWGYFNTATWLPEELLIDLELLQYYYEFPHGWEINTGTWNNIRIITQGSSCLSLEEAYNMLQRYENLIAFL